MSTEPIGLDGDVFTFINKKYINIHFTSEMWCTYSGNCKKDNLTFNCDDVCLLCKWRKPLDVPYILNKKEGEQDASN